MRILAVSHAYPRRANSSHGIFIHRLHTGILELGHQVEVIQRGAWAPPWPLYKLDGSWNANHEEQQAFLPGVDGVRLHHPLTVQPRPSRLFRGDAWDRHSRTVGRYAGRRLSRSGFDVVLAHFLVPDGYHALAVGRALGLPVVAMAWGDDAHAWPDRKKDWADKLRLVLRNADALVACSERMATDANKWMDTPRDDWHVVYGGVELGQTPSNGSREAARANALPAEVASRIPPGSKLALVLAQACVAKGYTELLDAWARIAPSHPDWRLVMAGGLGGDLNIETEVARRGLQARAHWIGPQPPNRIPALLRASDAFVLPSHNEGLSLSLLEAMAAGLPSITTDVGGHAEAIRSHDEGWLIPPHDTDALAGAMAELMSDDVERRRRGERARLAAARIGTPLDNARRLMAVLETAVVGAGATSGRTVT